MREQLIAIDDRLQPFLRNGSYSFIAPVDENNFGNFIELANRIAPPIAILRTVHHALGNRRATRQALAQVPVNIPLRIYVVTIVQNDQVLIHGTVEDYCRANNIDMVQVMGNPLD